MGITTFKPKIFYLNFNLGDAWAWAIRNEGTIKNFPTSLEWQKLVNLDIFITLLDRCEWICVWIYKWYTFAINIWVPQVLAFYLIYWSTNKYFRSNILIAILQLRSLNFIQVLKGYVMRFNHVKHLEQVSTGLLLVKILSRDLRFKSQILKEGLYLCGTAF